MSKQRQVARAQRERAAAQRGKQARARAAQRSAAQARQERRNQLWRRVRWWQHGRGFRRDRERWGALATLGLLMLLVVWLFSESVSDVVVTALALVICLPVLVLFVIDRRGP